MSVDIVQGDARHIELPDASVDLIVTSPPYFGLRSYTDGGVHYGGQIGAEDTPAEYVAALLDCTREWMRVLKPGGSLAAFPMELPRRCILGWSPPGICTECGEGRRPVTEYTGETGRWPGGGGGYLKIRAPGEKDTNLGSSPLRYRAVIGYSCACADAAASTRPAVVLDPFGGTGTTALLADVNGRHGVSVDMSADYCRIARWRTTDPGERARAMQVARPPVIPADQDALFDLGEAL